MMNDAKENEEADKIKKQEIEWANKLDTMIYQADAIASGEEDGLSSEIRQQLDAALHAAKTAAESGDASSYEGAHDDLQAAVHEAGKAMYKKHSETEQEVQDHPPQDDDDIIDAEYA
jgi:molecular chaperone DnaK